MEETHKPIMKKHLQFLMLLFLALTLASCGDDDKKNEPQSNNGNTQTEAPSELIGTWLYDDDIEPELYTFKKDGTFVRVIWTASRPEDKDVNTGTYRYNPEIRQLHLHEQDTSDDIYTVTIAGDVMYWLQDNGITITLYRQI